VTSRLRRGRRRVCRSFRSQGAANPPPGHFAVSIYSKSESEAEIDLYKVFHRRIERLLTAFDEIISSLTKDPDVRSKPILESAAGVSKEAIVGYVRRCTIEPLIYLCIGRVYRVSSRAKAPISNSFPLKNESGGGAGVITSFDATTGPPAKETTACVNKATTAKTDPFIIGMSIITAVSRSLRLG
jgi:hypothetical protein